MYFINSKPSYYHLLNSIPVLIPDFNNPFPVTGTGMENCIPKFWERERERKIAFPTFGNGNGNEKIIPNFRERESEAGIPGNGREREFPLTPASTYPLSSNSIAVCTLCFCSHSSSNWASRPYKTQDPICPVIFRTPFRSVEGWVSVRQRGSLGCWRDFSLGLTLSRP